MIQQTQSELHPSVKKLGWVSLINDAAAEMVYPLLPPFLATLGASPMSLGVLEGAAEATASFVKIASGRLGEIAARRKLLIVSGYAVTNTIRPLMAFATTPAFVIFLRVLDRLGKGLRTAPRDALIATVTPKERRAYAFGFHRGMDHWGGVVGPLLATGLLMVPGMDVRRVFLFALIPGLICIALTLGLDAGESRASPGEGKATSERIPRTPLGRPFWMFMAVQGLFCLAASSDTFLLLRAQNLGVPLAVIPALWALHHVLRATLSKHGGTYADRLGRRTTLAIGWLVYAGAYFVFAAGTSLVAALLGFAIYSAFFALAEGAEKALVADLVSPQNRSYAFGVFHGVTGAMLLAANLLTGALWTQTSAPVALAVSGTLSALAAGALLLAGGGLSDRHA